MSKKTLKMPFSVKKHCKNNNFSPKKYKKTQKMYIFINQLFIKTTIHKAIKIRYLYQAKRQLKKRQKRQNIFP